MTPTNLRRCAELLRSGEASAEIVAGEIECAADVLDRIQATHRLIARTEAGECWHWQGDGYDYPDSLACSVVIDHGGGTSAPRESLGRSCQAPDLG